jgi:hypothetical protein
MIEDMDHNHPNYVVSCVLKILTHADPYPHVGVQNKTGQAAVSSWITQL